MIWTVFILCAIMMFGAMCYPAKTNRDSLDQLVWILIGLAGMFGSMYLRHLGW